MDFALTDDHLALRDAVARYVANEYPANERGNPETPDLAARRYAGLAELGLCGLPLPEEHGGSALGAVELMLVAQELGRGLAGGAWFTTTALCAPLLARCASPAQQAEWLPALAAGTLQVALAGAEDDARHDWQQVSTRAQRDDADPAGAWTLNGRKTLVLHGDTAGLLLVLARTGGEGRDATGLTLFAVRPDQPGVTVQCFATLDGRRAAHVRLDHVRVTAAAVVGPVDGAAPHVAAAIDRMIAVLCGEAAGALDALVVLTTEHLRTRSQFGQTLSRFQALQHKLADLMIGLEQAKSMACAAAMAVDDADQLDATRRARVLAAAKVLIGQQGRTIGMAAIQLHGGMGMTDEARIGHYAKRLMVINQLFGDAGHHLQRFAALAAEPVAAAV